MTPVYIFLALALYAVSVCVYGWWNDPHVQFRRCVRRLTKSIHKNMIPAMNEMKLATDKASKAMNDFGKALNG